MSMMRLLSAGRSLVDTKTLTPNYRMRGKFHLPKFGGAKNPFVQPVKSKPEQARAVAPVAQPAVSKASEPVRAADVPVISALRRADLEIGDTAGLETCAAKSPAGSETSDASKPVEAATQMISIEPLKKTQRMPLPPEQLKETKKIPFVAARTNGLAAPASSPRQAVDEKHAGGTLAVPGLWRKVWGVVGGGFKKMNAFAWAMDHKPKQNSPIPRFDKPAQGELSLDNIRVVRNDLCDSDLEIAPAKTFSAQTNFKPALVPEKRKVENKNAEAENLFSHTCST